MNTGYDQLYRYLFTDADVRGELVKVQQSYAQILATGEYPPAVEKLLGELMAATALLTATLKFEGDIALQLQSEGPVKYAVINGSNEQKMRGVARWEGDVAELAFSDLFRKGYLVITITPKDGERYQGIVGLDKPSLAECLEGYFAQSEQLPTTVVLHTRGGDTPFAGGMLVQAMPSGQGDEEAFSNLTHLTQTITADELFDLAPMDVLHRLYHEQEVEVYPAVEIQFFCPCSHDRSASALATLEKAELMEVIAEKGQLDIQCEYCQTTYRFDQIDIEAIHAGTYQSQQSEQ